MATDTRELSVQRNDDDSDNQLSTHASALTEVASSRAAQEVQAQMVIAKRFPRDEMASLAKIVQACKRKRLAETAEYAYPKGGQMITGPSIRLAEVMARYWGNLDYGVVELQQWDGESQMLAFCWDLETNTRCQKVFTVRHARHTRRGAVALTDPREIYELTANQGARRLRACILSVIPDDIKESAVETCRKTLAGESKEPIIDRIRKMAAVFAELQVTQEMLETRLGHKLEVTTETELVNLRNIFNSLRDGMSQREQWFAVEPPPSTKKATRSSLNDSIGKGKPQEPTESSEPHDGALFDGSPDATEA